MRVAPGAEDSGTSVALGTFDGVHVGHRAVVRRAVEEGREKGLPVVAATFDPHPRAILRPENPPPLLTTAETRREALLAAGAQEVRVIPFDRELSSKSPERFVDDVLVGELAARVVVVGENFRFGYKAAGDVEQLGRLMRERGGGAVAVELSAGAAVGAAAGTGGEEVSSSRIRELIVEGEVAEAARLLGRPYEVRGEVVTGDKRGRTIGFPTANVLPDPRVVVPGRGVYAGFVRVAGEWYGACTNVGVAPTFYRQENRLEAYLIGYEGGEFYGETVDVGFTEKLRPEKRFSGIEELKDQISRDVEKARRVTGGPA